MNAEQTWETLEKYVVTITPRFNSLGDREYAWSVDGPDGRAVASGTTSYPAWRWVARRAALKAVRFAAHMGDNTERYTLKRERRCA